MKGSAGFGANNSGLGRNVMADQLQRSVDFKGNRVRKGADQYGSLASQASQKTAGASEVTISTAPKKVKNTLDEFTRFGYRNSVDHGSSIKKLSVI